MNILIHFCIFILTCKVCENGVFSSDYNSCSEDDVCSMKGTRLGDDGSNKCCQPCLCTENCTFGQCCPDASEFVERGAKCKHQLEFIPNIQVEEYLKILDIYARTTYYVVSECPPNTPFNLRIGCENTHGDFKYVNDAATYTIYKNEMCARCNGVTSYVQWRSAISANETDVNGILKDMNIHQDELERDRIVLSVPPVDYPDNINICCPTAISSCNETGLWDIYDENIVNLCGLSQLAPVVIPPIPYKNVFCALCNTVSTESLGVCTNNPQMKVLGQQTLKLLIWAPNNELVIPTKVKDKSNQCPLISGLESACRDIICPIGQYHVTDECVTGNFELYETKFEVGIHLELDSVAFVDNEYEFIKLNVLSHLKFEESKCLVVFYGVCHLLNTTTQYKMYIHVKTTEKCSTDTVLTVVRAFEMQFSTPYKIQQSPSEVIYVKALIASESMSNLGMVDWLNGSLTTPRHTPIDVHLKPKSYCASITYSANVVPSLLGEHVANAMMLASEVYMVDVGQTNAEHSGTRIICVSDYRRILIDNGLFNSGTIATPLFSINFLTSFFGAYYITSD